MPSRVFISHDHRDYELARVVARTLSRVTLNQLTVWFSSDRSPTGGIQLGGVWLDEIRTHLQQTKATIALLTPNSLARPAWLLFECGFALANPGYEIVPLCVGINTLDNVPAPLAMYQCYQLADYNSLKTVVAKLLARHDIAFDEEMAKPVLEAAVTEFAEKLSVPESPRAKAQPVADVDVAEAIREHVDRRFRELTERLGGAQQASNSKMVAEAASYPISILSRFPNRSQNHFLEIESDTTVSDVLDNVYFLLRPEVKPFTYLERWVLVERKTGKRLVIREVQNRIPARFVFPANSEWEAVPLALPYSGTDREMRDA